MDPHHHGHIDSFAARVLAHAAATPGRRAVVCDGEPLTYRSLVDQALRVAGQLRSLGYEPGGPRCVGIISANELDMVVVITACHFAGVTVVPIPYLILADAQSRMMDDAGVTIVFHDQDHAEAARAAVAQSRDPAKVELVPIGRGLLAGWLTAPPLARDAIPDEPGRIADIIYSSGTTGIPKGIVQSYAVRAASSATISRFGVGAGTHLIQTVSLYSNFGIVSMYLTLWCGGTFHIQRKFSAAAVVRLLATETIGMAFFAPATMVRTLESPGFEDAVRGRPASKLCCGAPLGADQKQRILDAWEGPLYDLYGQTETGTLTILSAHASPAEKLGSVGPALPTAIVKILDDEGRELPPDAEGEIAGHSTTLMSGYHGRAESAVSSWRDESGRRYIRTGDVGRLDADGYLWLCDRRKDLIISGGYNIYPADIERVLQGHPSVLEVAVVGFASTRWGETPVAFVTLREGREEEEIGLREWVNARVAGIQRVAQVRVLDTLPSGTMGKILKRELRDRFSGSIGVLP
jgi:acyl-CoA synthetase (AMP-forming)/AMP-acid ligase II